MSVYAQIFQPLNDLFTQNQVNTVLLAWLPTKLEPYMTGIIAVDMFITSVLACAIASLFPALYQFITTGAFNKSNKMITIQIEYYTEGKYGYLYTSVFYEALSWIISKQAKKLSKGSFVIQVTNSDFNDDEEDDCAPPKFNILPEKNEEISIEYKERKFTVTFQIPEEDDDSGGNKESKSKSKSKPSIYLSTIDDSNETNVDATSEFLNEIVRSYLESQKTMKIRSRYERNASDSYWDCVQSLSSIRGLDSIALDESHEELLKQELETFVNDKDFYARIGMPYRRGILLYGKPGTGKTSLINAISSQLSRDIYYLNLKNIKDDNELSAAFSEVPANQIIVLEDVDTQSRVLHKRTSNSNSSSTSSTSSTSSVTTEPSKSESKVDKFSEFSLSTFLGCLDGHILAEGNIIIMTTNHVEHLDPAVIRPGRMDVQLNLGYCTHYQINKMYKSVIENSETEFPRDILEKIPEKLLPPCEVMMTMILYRRQVELIPQKIYELVAKYQNIKSDDKSDTSDNLNEKKEAKLEGVNEKKEEVKDEVKEKEEKVKNEIKKEVKDEVKEKKDEVKDEINEKKEEVKDEVKEKKDEVKDEINEKKEEVKDEAKEKKEEEVKDEINKKEEEIIIEANINNSNNTEEDSDSNTDVELENDNENDKINYFKTVETLTITPQVA